jgi:hypothetical protein
VVLEWWAISLIVGSIVVVFVFVTLVILL